MKHHLGALFCVLGVLACAPSAATASDTPGEALSIRIATRLAAEPAQVLVRTRVEPDARSRDLTIEWWTAEGFGGSHLISLQGKRAAIWHDYFIKQMEAGEYQVTAVLTRSDGTQVRRTSTVIVVGKGGGAYPPAVASASR